MSVLSDILEWSSDRPIWQRDALRRILTQDKLTDEDIEELYRICLAQRGITNVEEPAPEPHPLSPEHLPQHEGAVEQIQLIGLKDIQGVNALAEGQHMSFEIDGLTIIFGYNGSGKSAYARILRSLCHARHRGDRILQNVYVDTDQPTPTATIDFRIADVNHSIQWQQGQNPPRELGRVSFFDADCASVHVNDANELAFTPFGLDALPKLVNVCQRVSESIQDFINEVERSQAPSLANIQAAEGTEVRRMLEEMNETSDIEDFLSLAKLSADDLNRINELKEVLGTDPITRAWELKNTIGRLKRLEQNLKLVAHVLSAQSVEDIRLKLQDVINKKTATEVAANEAFSGQPLSGVGEEIWQDLWESARKYSRLKAYPEQDFPYTEQDARCVLCQQTLGSNAKRRLIAFEKFVKDDIQKVAEHAIDEWKTALIPIENLTVGYMAYKDYLSDFPDSQYELAKSIRRFHRVAWKIKRSILKSCFNIHWTTPCNLPADPTPELTSLIQEIVLHVTELEDSKNEETRAILIEEQNELLARQWLGGVLCDIEAEINRKKKLTALEKAIGDTVTTGITRKSGELANKYITDVLRTRLTDEIKKLGADHLEVELDVLGGRLGQQRFKINLHGAQSNTVVREILSEGEFRCIALAGFLSELSSEQSYSGLIFDDPVSSLDHKWRRKVANRLVELALERQVIVFTHDIVFLSNLVDYCQKNGVALRQNYLHWGPTQPGVCDNSLPWIAMKVSSRIGYLKNLLQSAEANYRKNGEEAYEPEARRIYGLLRESWERAVEEVLLNGVVTRFDFAIHTQQLNILADITDDDIRKIDQGMTKASRFLAGHDEAEAIADLVPGPEELRQDIINLENLIAEVRRRRR